MASKGGGKGTALTPVSGMKSITSFFCRTPQPAKEPSVKKPVEEEKEAFASPPRDEPTTSPSTASSGLKTKTKSQQQHAEVALAPAVPAAGRKKRNLLDSDSDEEVEKKGSKKGRGNDSSLSPEALAAAKSVKASSTAVIVGSCVELRVDRDDWEKGKVVRQSISGAWQVELEKGGKKEVSIPSTDVRIVVEHAKSGSAGTSKRSCTVKRKRLVLDSSDEDSEVPDGDDDSNFEAKDAEEEEEEEEEDAASSGSEDEDVKKRKPASRKPKSKTQKTEEPLVQAPAKKAPIFEMSPGVNGPTSSSDKALFKKAAMGGNSLQDQKREKLDGAKEANNAQRYKWLLNIKDAQGRPPTHPEYDHRTVLVPKSDYQNMTNFEKQFWDIKKDRWDMVLFFKKGKFYEMFENDADIGNQKLGLKLTPRTNMRMCGIPEGHFASYANRLVALGYKVGRVEQMETLNARDKRTKSVGQKTTGAVCERALCEVLTQGTLMDVNMMEGPQANFLLTIKQGSCKKDFGVCLLEASTGLFCLGQFTDDTMYTHLETLLLRCKPREVVFTKGEVEPMCLKMCKRHLHNPIINAMDPGEQFWNFERTMQELKSSGYFDEGHGEWPSVLKDMEEKGETLALCAVGGCISYLRSLLMDKELVSMRNFKRYDDYDFGRGNLIIDGQTLANLEILENQKNGGVEGTLLKHFDRCATGFGKRLFRSWMCSPLQDVEAINARLDVVDRFALSDDGRSLRTSFIKLLRGLPDIERSLSKIHMEAGGRKQGVMFDDTASRKVKEFIKLFDALDNLCQIQDMVNEDPADGSKSLAACMPGVAFPSKLRKTLNNFRSKYGDLNKAASDGYVSLEPGVDKEFDEAVERVDAIKEELDNELKRCRKLIGNNSLKFYSPGTGKEPYQIEVPIDKGNKLGREFELKSKTAKVGRYWTDKIRECVHELVDAEENLAEHRQGVAMKMLKHFDSHHATWLRAVEATAVLDCLISLSFSADEKGEGPVCRPVLVQGGKDEAMLEALQSRHPCLKGKPGTAFIPNDIIMGGEDGARGFVVTGPNMGGKSTLLRQACVITMMAQMGAYVPAESCRLSPCDRIFTRIGANDRIIAGQSTFLVELSETSTILQHATARSLVVLDELGRGTSTHDGYAIAHAVLSDLMLRVRPLLLFSTHYHTLTDEMRDNSELALYHMSCLVEDAARTVTFLYKFTPGSTKESYGLHCAQAAGLPGPVLERAEQKKKDLEITGEHLLPRRIALFQAVARLAKRQKIDSTKSLLELQQQVLSAIR